MVAGATNGVNLTDGLDGLAAGTTTSRALLHGICLVGYLVSAKDRPSRLDLATFCAALLGACVGFLWYNSFPADVFMGDTGSLGLGGALGGAGGLHQDRAAAVLIGGVFVVEALSVIIQVVSFSGSADASS